MSQEFRKDDALFEELARNKKRRRRRVLITVISILLVLAVGLTITVSTLRRRVQQRYGLSGIDVRSYVVTRGTLSTVVSGSGILGEDELESVTVPDGVALDEVLVEAYETVTEGQMLATVDIPSVMSAMAALQETMADLDEQIRDAQSDKVSTSVNTAVAGRVKVIYGQKDMSVMDCMVNHGALAVLSLDGYMALDLQTDVLKPGDTVTVLRENGNELKGTVDTVIAGTATILVTDDGPLNAERVTVRQGETDLGEAALYIHEPLAITGYAGTIQSVLVTENRKVYKNSGIFRLTDTGTTYNYETLLRQRSEHEETMLELLNLRRTGAVLAPFCGSVYTVDYDETLAPGAVATLSRDEKMTVTLSVDESDILSLELGQVAEITVPSLSDAPFPGTVTQINRTSAASGTYSAVVTVEKAPDMLSGMTAEVSIRITGVENALLIPVEAVQQTRTGAYVYTTYDPETETFGGETPITLGMMGVNEAEVLTGLTEGITVWYTEEMTIFDFFAGAMGMNGTGGKPSGGMPTGGMPSGGMPSGGNPGGPPSGNRG